MPTPTSALTSPLSTTAFVNQIALVTGASGGIGGAIANALAALDESAARYLHYCWSGPVGARFDALRLCLISA